MPSYVLQMLLTAGIVFLRFRSLLSNGLAVEKTVVLESLKAKLITDESSFFCIRSFIIRLFCFSRMP